MSRDSPNQDFIHPRGLADVYPCPHFSMLEPIETAAPTSHDPALPTLIDVVRKSVEALLTLVAAATRSPRSVFALVVLYQVGPGLFHQIRVGLCLLFRQILAIPACHGSGGSEASGPSIAVDDAVRTVEQTPLLPMGTRARLPGLATHVAELCTTSAGWWVAKKGMVSACFDER